MESAELRLLVQQYLAESISEEDFHRLWQTLNEPASETEWLATIEEALYTKQPSGYARPDQADLALENIKAKIYSETHPRSRVYGLLHHNRQFLRYAAAIVIMVSVAVLVRYTSGKHEMINQTTAAVSISQNVEPGGEKAMLTLADGTTIVLDNAGNGQIAEQGHTQIIKLANGEIQYKSLNKPTGADQKTAFNTMSTPRGGQYQLVLPDGSKVWLNSETSITYPVAFSNNERRVKITGEAYFEVAKDKTKPFRVVTNEMEVEVLGTHFNVNAYADDGPAKTSLLEGSVKIDKSVLVPGQAYVNGEVVRTDVEQDVAWKNGIFNFNNQKLPQVMKQLARWYDLDVQYPEGIPQKEYGGEIGKNLRLDQVLKGLGNSGVHFEVNGKVVKVKMNR